MSYLWAIISFILGAIQFGSGSTEVAIGWFIVSGLFTIAANINYGGRNNG